MRVVLYWAEGRAQPWIDGLRARLPQAEVVLWDGEGVCPPGDYGVVWAPPQAFFDAQPGLKAVFNLGAGVDALLRVRVPQQTAVVRLEDAGMSVQMAEYVCHAVVRHFRELDAYQTEQEAGRWSFRKPRLRSEFPVGVLGLGVLGSRVAATVRQFEARLPDMVRLAPEVVTILPYTDYVQTSTETLRAGYAHIFDALGPLASAGGESLGTAFSDAGVFLCCEALGFFLSSQDGHADQTGHECGEYASTNAYVVCRQNDCRVINTKGELRCILF